MTQIIYYICDGCKKKVDEAFHFDFAGKKMDFCMICGTLVSNAVGEALEKINDEIEALVKQEKK